MKKFISGTIKTFNLYKKNMGFFFESVIDMKGATTYSSAEKYISL